MGVPLRGRGAAARTPRRPSAKPVKPARTHWDMLLERRTTAELEELLEERLELLRSGALTAAAAERLTPAPGGTVVRRILLSGLVRRLLRGR